MISKNEVCWVLTGKRFDPAWLMRSRWKTVGLPTTVGFSWREVIAREEACRDVLGYLHTHPTFKAYPSEMDILTMRGWVTAFAKPLVCVIRGTDGLRAWVFENDESHGVAARMVFQIRSRVIMIS